MPLPFAVLPNDEKQNIFRKSSGITAPSSSEDSWFVNEILKAPDSKHALYRNKRSKNADDASTSHRINYQQSLSTVVEYDRNDRKIHKKDTRNDEGTGDHNNMSDSILNIKDANVNEGERNGIYERIKDETRALSRYRELEEIGKGFHSDNSGRKSSLENNVNTPKIDMIRPMKHFHEVSKYQKINNVSSYEKYKHNFDLTSENYDKHSEESSLNQVIFENGSSLPQKVYRFNVKKEKKHEKNKINLLNNSRGDLNTSDTEVNSDIFQKTLRKFEKGDISKVPLNPKISEQMQHVPTPKVGETFHEKAYLEGTQRSVTDSISSTERDVAKMARSAHEQQHNNSSNDIDNDYWMMSASVAVAVLRAGGTDKDANSAASMVIANAPELPRKQMNPNDFLLALASKVGDEMLNIGMSKYLANRVANAILSNEYNNKKSKKDVDGREISKNESILQKKKTVRIVPPVNKRSTQSGTDADSHSTISINSKLKAKTDQLRTAVNKMMEIRDDRKKSKAKKIKPNIPNDPNSYHTKGQNENESEEIEEESSQEYESIPQKKKTVRIVPPVNKRSTQSETDEESTSTISINSKLKATTDQLRTVVNKMMEIRDDKKKSNAKKIKSNIPNDPNSYHTKDQNENESEEIEEESYHKYKESNTTRSMTKSDSKSIDQLQSSMADMMKRVENITEEKKKMMETLEKMDKAKKAVDNYNILGEEMYQKMMKITEEKDACISKIEKMKQFEHKWKKDEWMRCKVDEKKTKLISALQARLESTETERKKLSLEIDKWKKDEWMRCKVDEKKTKLISALQARLESTETERKKLFLEIDDLRSKLSSNEIEKIQLSKKIKMVEVMHKRQLDSLSLAASDANTLKEKEALNKIAAMEKERYALAEEVRRITQAEKKHKRSEEQLQKKLAKMTLERNKLKKEIEDLKVYIADQLSKVDEIQSKRTELELKKERDRSKQEKDELEKCIEGLRFQISNMEFDNDKAVAMQTKLESAENDKEELSYEINRLRENLATSKSETIKLSNKCEELKASQSLKKLEKEKDELTSTINKLQNKILSNQVENRKLVKECKEAEALQIKLEATEREKESLLKELKNLKGEFDSYDTEREKNAKDLFSQTKLLSIEEDKNADLSKEVNELLETVSNYESEKARLLKESEQMIETITNYEAERAKLLKECEQMKYLKAHLQTTEEEKKKLSDTINELRDQLVLSETEKRKLSKKCEEMKALQVTLKAMEEEKERLLQEMKELRDELISITGEKNILLDKIQTMHIISDQRQNDAVTARQQLNDKDEEIKKLMTSNEKETSELVAEIKLVMEEARKHKDNEEQLRAKLDIVTNETRGVRVQNDSLKEYIAEIMESLGEKIDYAEAASELGKHNYDTNDESLTTTTNENNSEIISSIDSIVSTHLKRSDEVSVTSESFFRDTPTVSLRNSLSSIVDTDSSIETKKNRNRAKNRGKEIVNTDFCLASSRKERLIDLMSEESIEVVHGQGANILYSDAATTKEDLPSYHTMAKNIVNDARNDIEAFGVENNSWTEWSEIPSSSSPTTGSRYGNPASLLPTKEKSGDDNNDRQQRRRKKLKKQMNLISKRFRKSMSRKESKRSI